MDRFGVGLKSWMRSRLERLERWGNRLPDPVLLFVWGMCGCWILSWVLSPIPFQVQDPLTGQPIRVSNQLTPQAIIRFLTNLVETFVHFPPLGLVLVALLGVGVAEHTGFIPTGLKLLLHVTPRRLVTPMLLIVSLLSHAAGDTGYVLVVPMGGVIFSVAGRHPLAGLACAFAGVSGGFSANLLPSALDPLLQGFTQSAARLIDPTRDVNPLCNWWFMLASSGIILALGWFVTDWLVEPALARTYVDADPADLPRMQAVTERDRRGFFAGCLVLGLLVLGLVVTAWPMQSLWRSPTGDLTSRDAPLMKAIVPLIFLMFLLPGTVHGYLAGTVRNHRDLVEGMSKSMSLMGYYLVLAFFSAQFTAIFKDSNLGALLAVEGATLLKSWALPTWATVIGVIGMTAVLDMIIGSASAKWAILSLIFVPMLMQLGISPELTQAAYRIGDSTTNIITPLMPYFPLMVVYAQRYVRSTGIGSIIALMLPYSITFLVAWTALLMLFWSFQIPLGINAGYQYPIP